MFFAVVIVSALLAVLLVMSASLKLTHRPHVVEGYLRVGVPEGMLNYLAAILLAGAAGLVVGLWWSPVGLAAAAGLTCYFVLAIAAHLRAGDARRLPPPLAFAALGAAALTLQLITLTG